MRQYLQARGCVEMESKRSFDKAFLLKYVQMWTEALKCDNLSDSEKQILRYEKAVFNKFLRGDFNILDGYVGHYKSIENLKRYTLMKMQYEYNTIGSDVVDYILDLNQANLFCSVGTPRPNVPFEVQQEYTLKNYEKNCKRFLKYAERVFYSKITSQIQCVRRLDCSSFCHYSELLDLPFLVINPKETSYILNHEIQHAIDYMLKYQTTNNYYSELLPIYFELLFDDLLFDDKGICDYDCRLDEMNSLILDVCEYLRAMKEFASLEFKVSLEEFKQIIMNCFSIDESLLIDCLNDIVVSDDFDGNFMYLISYIKAIELRNDFYNKKGSSLDLILPYANIADFQYSPDYKHFDVYSSFIEEACAKQLKMKL